MNIFRFVYHFQALETESSDEEEVEPKLKYVRISNDLKKILSKDAVSCIAVHSKVISDDFFFVDLISTKSISNFCSSYALERTGVPCIYSTIKAIRFPMR